MSILAHHLHMGLTAKLFGYGRPTRDYVHVDDVVRAMRAASGTAGVFNMATGIETDVMSIWEKLRHASGAILEPELALLRTGELEGSCLDPSHARDRLGWRAQVPLHDGLVETYRALIAEFENDT